MSEFSAFHEKIPWFCINLSYILLSIGYKFFWHKWTLIIPKWVKSTNLTAHSQSVCKIYRMVYELNIYDEFLFRLFFTSRDIYVEKLLFTRIWSIHATIDRSRQTEWEYAVKLVLLTHFGMISVHLCQKHL